MTWVDEVKAWKTHDIGLSCVKVVGIECPTPNSNQTKWKGEISSVGREGRKEKKKRKERKKERKKEKKKRRKEGRRKEEEMKEKMRSWSALQQVGSSPTWDTLV